MILIHNIFIWNFPIHEIVGMSSSGNVLVKRKISCLTVFLFYMFIRSCLDQNTYHFLVNLVLCVF